MAQNSAKKANVVNNFSPTNNSFPTNNNNIYIGMNNWYVADGAGAQQFEVLNAESVWFVGGGILSVSFSDPEIIFTVPNTLSSFSNDAGFITDAPFDSQTYGRNNGAWVVTASGITFETNGTPNMTQNLLNLVQGTNMTITDDGMGNITFDSSGGGGSGINSGLRYIDSPGNQGTNGYSYWDGSSTLYVNRYDAFGADNYNYLNGLVINNNILYHGRTTTDYLVFEITAVTWTGTYFQFTVNNLGGSGSPINMDVAIDFERNDGSSGGPGPNGLNSGFRYTDSSGNQGSSGYSYYDGSANIYFNQYGSSGEDNYTYLNGVIPGDVIIYKGRNTTDYVVFTVTSVSWNGTYFTFNGTTNGGSGSPINMDVGVDFEMINGAPGSNGFASYADYPLYDAGSGHIAVYYAYTGQDGVISYAEYLSFVAKLDDAPSDNVHYDRQNATWVNARSYPTADKTVSDNGYTVAINTDYMQRWDVSGGSSTTTLPAVASCTGQSFVFKKIDSSTNTLTITGSGSETIDGSNTYILTVEWESVTLFSNGVTWDII